MLGPFANANRFTPIHRVSLAVLSRATCASMSTTSTTTTRDRGDRYGRMEWAQSSGTITCKLMILYNNDIKTINIGWAFCRCSAVNSYLYNCHIYDKTQDFSCSWLTWELGWHTDLKTDAKVLAIHSSSLQPSTTEAWLVLLNLDFHICQKLPNSRCITVSFKLSEKSFWLQFSFLRIASLYIILFLFMASNSLPCLGLPHASLILKESNNACFKADSSSPHQYL